ncbi:MAG: hypothetical protein LM569_00565 [Desulfurococcaceae archaeon]|nr:hypothetical protein [Desulfurococcaceae archaeon]
MKVIEVSCVKNLDLFIKKLSDLGLKIELGPHVVLEDHSELAVFKVLRNGELEAYIVAHYITQYYRAVLSESYSNDSAFARELLAIKYSGERWSIPVNHVYVITNSSTLVDYVKEYRDEYPVPDGESLVDTYRSRNPNYKSIPRIVIGRLVDTEV